MTSNRPYLIRALYEWILDNAMTPHILVNAVLSGVEVPTQHVHEGRIVLNVSPSAVQGLQIGNDWIEFSARFGGLARTVRVPVMAVLAIYARENGQGTAFPEELGYEPPPSPPEPPQQPERGKRPALKVVK